MAVNKLDNSMIDANTIGTSANQLLKLDGTAKIPVADGSLLTGLPASFTSSASDPTISTNPSGGVGTLWKNTTSGEVYCCTNATAGANVWTNVGAGTGNVAPAVYQGETYGYYAGGAITSGPRTNRIEKWSFTSDGNSVDTTADLINSLQYCAGASSTTHGYACSGTTGSYTDVIQKWAFASTANATDVGNSTVSGEGIAGHSSRTHGYTSGVYSSGPMPYGDTIQKWSFASGTQNAADVGNLTGGNTYGPTTWSDFDRDYGWTGCVGFVTGWTYKDNIEKFSYSSDGNSIDVCNMFLAGGNRSSSNSTDYGYAWGGNTPASFSNEMQKFSMVSGTNGTDVGNLAAGVHNTGSPDASSTTYGYCTGGQGTGSGRVDHIQKRAFASDGNASDIANLTEAKYWGAKAHL